MEFIEAKTKNGIPVYMMPINGLKSVACGVLINVGSRDEGVEREFGLAHAMEHMPFKGTKNFYDNLALTSYIEEVGGCVNAQTSKDRTFFHGKAPDYESERLVNWLHEVLELPLLRESDWEKEKKVIIEEINRGNDNPDRYFYDWSMKNLYPNHPLEHPVLGTEGTISALNISDLSGFYRKYYNPGNYSIFAAGNIDSDKFLNLLDGHFGDINTGFINDRRQAGLPKPGSNIFIGKKDFKQNKIEIDFLIPTPSLEEREVLSIFKSMLGSGFSATLFQEFRIKRNMVYSVSASYYGGLGAGDFSINLSTSHKDYEEIKKIAMDVIEKTKNDKRQFEQTKKRLLGGLSFAFENPMGIISSAAIEKLYSGKPFGYNESKKMIEETSFEEVRRLADKYLTEDNCYLNVLLSER